MNDEEKAKQEALDFARPYLENQFLRCGDSWWLPLDGTFDHSKPDWTLATEFKGIKYHVSLSRAAPLSEIDRMNNVEVKELSSSVYLDFHVHRIWTSSLPFDSSQPLQWSAGEWKEGSGLVPEYYTASLERVKGQWRLNNSYDLTKYKAIPTDACAKLPK